MIPVEVRAFHGAVMREVMGMLSATIHGEGLGPAQISALFRLRAGPVTVSGLGGQLGLTSGAISHLVEQLVRKALVERVEDASDRRIRRVRLTVPGVRFLTDFDAQLDSALQHLLDPVPPDALNALASALRGVLAHIVDTADGMRAAAPP